MNHEKLVSEYRKIYGTDPSFLELSQFSKNRVRTNFEQDDGGFASLTGKFNVSSGWRAAHEARERDRRNNDKERAELMSQAMQYIRSGDLSIYSKSLNRETTTRRAKEIRYIIGAFKITTNECTECLNQVLGTKRFNPSSVSYIYNRTLVGEAQNKKTGIVAGLSKAEYQKMYYKSHRGKNVKKK